MAEAVHPYHERRASERRRIAYPGLLRSADGVRVSWGGIFGGVLVAVGLLLLLAALGVAVGISAVDPAQTDATKLGAGAGIWTGVSLLIALFVGGMVATRIGATSDSHTTFYSGFLVWVVSVVLMAYLTASGAASLAGGAFNLFAQTQSTQQKQQAAGTLQQKAQELQQKAPELQQKAQEAKPAATKAAWIAFGGLLLSLIAAVLGATVGRRRALPPATRPS